VPILRRQLFGGMQVFVIEQNDGTLAHIPCWMLDQDAGELTLQPYPRLSLSVLRDLRIEVSSLLESLESDLPRMEVLDEAQTSAAATAGSVRSCSADPSIAEQGEPASTLDLSFERDPDNTAGKKRRGAR
jgi:hypothetical protein